MDAPVNGRIINAVLIIHHGFSNSQYEHVAASLRRSSLLAKTRGLLRADALATTVLNVKSEKEDLRNLSTPGLIGVHHGIQNHKQFSHTSRKRDLLFLSDKDIHLE